MIIMSQISQLVVNKGKLPHFLISIFDSHLMILRYLYFSKISATLFYCNPINTIANIFQDNIE